MAIVTIVGAGNLYVTVYGGRTRYGKGLLRKAICQ